MDEKVASEGQTLEQAMNLAVDSFRYLCALDYAERPRFRDTLGTRFRSLYKENPA